MGNRELFKGFWIDQSDYAWPKHPVVRLSMAGVDVSRLDYFKQSLHLRLDQIALEHKLILESTHSVSDKFRTLISELAKQNRVVVLIDEYDYPILNHLHDPKTANEMRDILKSFYGVLKDLDAQLRFVFLNIFTVLRRSMESQMQRSSINSKTGTMVIDSRPIQKKKYITPVPYSDA